MKLAGELFDRRGDPRSGAVDGVADDRKAAMLHGVKNSPPRKVGEGVRSMRGIVGMRFGEDEKLRLEANDFFEIDVRPILGGVDD